MRPRLDHRLVAVSGGEDAARTCDRIAAGARRIAGTVEAFTQLADETGDGRQRNGLAQHSLAELRYEADALPLRHAQRTGLVPDRVGDPEPPEPGSEARRGAATHGRGSGG